MSVSPLLTVEGLSVAFGSPRAPIKVVDDVSFAVRKGETLALVGESGSGKTLTGKALLGILPKGARITSGSAVLDDGKGRDDLLKMPPQDLRKVRGARVSMIFQEPMSSLSALHTIGNQVMEAVLLHRNCGKAEARRRCIETFKSVDFPDPERAFAAYPFELSGGLRQRAMIAMAMVSKPSLMIADEPTTALDVTTQATVLDLIKNLQRENGMSVIMVTHDLGVVANMADSVVVLRKGEVVESGPARAVLTHPGHGYTRKLIDAAPEIPDDLSPRHEAGHDFIMRAEHLSKTYPGKAQGFGRMSDPVKAVQDVRIDIRRGETLAVVGESGSGKSTVAKLMLQAERPDPGASVIFKGADGVEIDVAALHGQALIKFRRKVQIVFQDPFASLSPRMNVRDILTEPLRVHGVGTPSEQRERAADLMERVGLSADHLQRFPHAFSGGQRQRISIARALALGPELLVCDEPTSALDVSVQAQVLDLFKEIRDEFNLSYLFISHDLAVVADLADRVAVMRRGRVVEEGPRKAVFENPVHPYTQALMAASPEPDMDKTLDLAAVALGAGEPNTWAPPYGYDGDAAPGLCEIETGHFVRRAA